MNVHKMLSDIEKDIAAYYAGNFDGLDVAITIAGRALAVAAHLHGGAQLLEAKQIVFDQILERQQ